MSSRL